MLSGNYEQLLRKICEHIQPKRILEFGSGESTKIFAEYGQVTCFEYDPPGNWADIRSDRVEFVYVERETSATAKNLVDAVCKYLFETLKKEADYDIVRNCRLRGGTDVPQWDLVYSDGAIHLEQFGWCGGDISYIARTMFAGLLLPYARYVVIDDVPFVPTLATMKPQIMGRFCVIDTAGTTNWEAVEAVAQGNNA